MTDINDNETYWQFHSFVELFGNFSLEIHIFFEATVCKYEHYLILTVVDAFRVFYHFTGYVLEIPRTRKLEGLAFLLIEIDKLFYGLTSLGKYVVVESETLRSLVTALKLGSKTVSLYRLQF